MFMFCLVLRGKQTSGSCIVVQIHPINKWWYCISSSGNKLRRHPPRKQIETYIWKLLSSTPMSSIKFSANGKLWGLHKETKVINGWNGIDWIEYSDASVSCVQFDVGEDYFLCVDDSSNLHKQIITLSGGEYFLKIWQHCV